LNTDETQIFQSKNGARASARFNVGKPNDFRPIFGNWKLKRHERRAPKFCRGATVEISPAHCAGLAVPK
jgi:hypothetical protein